MPRLSIQVQGVVQGVGFRPFVYRLALERQLLGWVRNRPDGVEIEIQGPQAALESFLQALQDERPAPARIRSVAARPVPDQAGESAFQILKSADSAETRPSVPADLATCPECAREMDTPGERRHRYPFTNCTYCGPRYTIIAGLPYDRPKTSMRDFPLCPACQREYEDPLDRRFHAQPVACPVCGPRLRLVSPAGDPLAEREAALNQAVQALLQGQVLALKGIGGYQLLVDATSEPAVARLRARKRREEKPFAVMFPGLAALREACLVSDAETEALQSPEAPILLLRRSPQAAGIAEGIAPRNPFLGAFLPYTPLHRLVLGAAQRPLVCTSGNLSDEPMAYADEEALERLGGIADTFLMHDRPILRPVDDSVLRLDAHGPTMLRRARGYAPFSHPLAVEAPPILALGAHQKNTIALFARGEVVLSPHLGDLHSAEGVRLQERTVEDLMAFLDVRPELLACDLHPDYASTRLAERLSERWGVPLRRFQHHHAHGAAVLAEHGIEEPALALAWDGTGYGHDGTIWGGEALLLDGAAATRFAHLKAFPLPGGERAVREPRRAALGLAHAFLPEAMARLRGRFTDLEWRTLHQTLAQQLHAPLTSSIGRLFDAVAALVGIRAGSGFEGQAAMELEFAAHRSSDPGSYPWRFEPGACWGIDPGPMLQALLQDLDRGLALEDVARRFHTALVDLARETARRAARPVVALSGGCFQNRLLAEQITAGLHADGFRVLAPHLFPPNDGAISLGQVALVAWAHREERQR